MPSQRSDRLQLNEHGRLRHFLTIEGLSRDLLVQILDTAESFAKLPVPAAKEAPAWLSKWNKQQKHINYKVLVGGFADRDDAVTLRRDLVEMGYEGAWIFEK